MRGINRLAQVSLDTLKHPETGLARFILLTSFLLAVLVRQPAFLLHPRFFCEEGVAFYQYAYGHSSFDSLTFVFPGYYSFLQNVGALLASRLANPEHAPLVTTLFGTAVQMLPYAVIIWSHAAFWQGNFRKLLGCAAVLFTAVSDDVWMTTLCLHFHLSLSVALLLLEDTPGRNLKRRLGEVVLVATAGLSSPVSGFLTPIFFLKGWLEKRKDTMIHSGILACTSIMQAVIILSAHDVLQGRVRDLDFQSTMAIWFNKSIIMPLAGVRAASWSAFQIFEPLRDSGTLSSIWCGIGFVLMLSLLFMIIGHGQNKRPAFYLLTSYSLLLMLSITTSVLAGDKFRLVRPLEHTRYFYAPNVLLVLALLGGLASQAERLPWQSILCGGLLFSALAFGMWEYRQMHSYSADWPDWASECAKWRQDPSYAPKTWPPPSPVFLGRAKSE